MPTGGPGSFRRVRPEGPLADRGDAPGRLAQTALVELSRGDGRDDRGLDGLDSVLAEIVADEERVDPGGKREDRAALDADRLAEPLHLERVRDHEPVVAELDAKQVVHDGAAGGRRRVVELRHPHVRRHDRLHARLDRGAKRQQPLAEGAGRRPAARGGSPARSSRARESAWRTPRLPGSGARGRRLRRGARRARGSDPERADPDHRVRRIDVHVGHRGEVEVHADGREVGPDRRRDLLGQLLVVDGPERAVPGIGAAAVDLEPGDVAALLVDPDQQLGPRRPERGGQLGASCSGRARCRRRGRSRRARPRSAGAPSRAPRNPESSGRCRPQRAVRARCSGGLIRAPPRRSARRRSGGGRSGRRSRPGSRSASRRPSARPSRCRGSFRGSRRATR